MAGFFTNFFDELGERRRRLRKSLGDRGQALASFAVLAGLMLGSIGLYLKPWMIGVSPWGFGVPVLFVIGYLLIEWRRQADLARSETEALATRYDWTARLFSLACALAGSAAFVIAFSSEPPAPHIEEWTPPESAVSVDISP